MAGGPERHRRKCNSIFANLIAIREERDMRACEYVNEFFETMRRCDNDDVYDMSVIHYHHDWHKKKKKQLMSAVDWPPPTWIKIHTIDRVTNTMATLGLIGFAYGAHYDLLC